MDRIMIVRLLVCFAGTLRPRSLESFENPDFSESRFKGHHSGPEFRPTVTAKLTLSSWQRGSKPWPSGDWPEVFDKDKSFALKLVHWQLKVISHRPFHETGCRRNSFWKYSEFLPLFTKQCLLKIQGTKIQNFIINFIIVKDRKCKNSNIGVLVPHCPLFKFCNLHRLGTV